MKKSKLINRPRLVCSECKVECISCGKCDKLLEEGEIFCDNNYSDKASHYCLECGKDE